MEMEVVAVILVMVGIIQVRILGFIYPIWRANKGRELTEYQKYGVDALAIGILLLTVVFAWVIV